MSSINRRNVKVFAAIIGGSAVVTIGAHERGDHGRSTLKPGHGEEHAR